MKLIIALALEMALETPQEIQDPKFLDRVNNAVKEFVYNNCVVMNVMSDDGQRIIGRVSLINDDVLKQHIPSMHNQALDF